MYIDLGSQRERGTLDFQTFLSDLRYEIELINRQRIIYYYCSVFCTLKRTLHLDN